MLEGPAHEGLGLDQDKWRRIVSGINNHRRLNINAINNIQQVLSAAVSHIHKLEGQDKTSAVEQWLDRILDPSQGYSLAHRVARVTPKAPPLPTELWDKDKYLGHPHLIIAQAFLDQWGGYGARRTTLAMPTCGIK